MLRVIPFTTAVPLIGFQSLSVTRCRPRPHPFYCASALLRFASANKPVTFDALTAAVRSENCKDTLAALRALRSRDITPPVSLFPPVIKCVGHTDIGLEQCKRWLLKLERLERSGIDVRTYTSFIQAAAAKGEHALVDEWLLRMVKGNCQPDVFFFAGLIKTDAIRGDLRRCFHWWEELKKQQIQLDIVLFVVLLDACAKLGTVAQCEEVRQEMTKCGIQPNVNVCHIMLTAYYRHGELVKCEQLLQSMQRDGPTPTHTSYGIVIDAFCCWYEPERAFRLLLQMERQGQGLARRGYAALIQGACQVGDYETCVAVLQHIKDLGVPLVSRTYHTLVDAFGQAGRIDLCLELWNDMISQGFTPNNQAYEALMGAFSVVRDFEQCWSSIPGFPALNSFFLEKLAELGELDEGFKLLQQRMDWLSLAECNVLLRVFMQLGDPIRCCELIDLMSAAGVQPNGASYGIVIAAHRMVNDEGGWRRWYGKMQGAGVQLDSDDCSQLLEVLVSTGHIEWCEDLLHDMLEWKLRFGKLEGKKWRRKLARSAQCVALLDQLAE